MASFFKYINSFAYLQVIPLPPACAAYRHATIDGRSLVPAHTRCSGSGVPRACPYFIYFLNSRPTILHCKTIYNDFSHLPFLSDNAVCISYYIIPYFTILQWNDNIDDFSFFTIKNPPANVTTNYCSGPNGNILGVLFNFRDVARLGEKAPIGLSSAAVGSLKFGFSALLLFGLLF